MTDWELIEERRWWIPSWVFALLCLGPRRWMLRQPFRWVLFQKVPLPTPPEPN